MPNIELIRNWCVSCQDYKIFKNDICNSCENKFEPYNLSSIPSVKRIEQIKRYKEYISRYHRNFLQGAINGHFDNNLVEHDAGYEKILLEERKQREAMIKEKVAYARSFDNLNRNDKCNCGSGKKYKQCHLPEITAIKVDFQFAF